MLPRSSTMHSLPSRCGAAHLAVAAILDVLLPVQEPVGDLVGAGVGHDGHDALQLLSRQLARAAAGEGASAGGGRSKSNRQQASSAAIALRTRLHTQSCDGHRPCSTGSAPSSRSNPAAAHSSARAAAGRPPRRWRRPICRKAAAALGPAQKHSKVANMSAGRACCPHGAPAGCSGLPCWTATGQKLATVCQRLTSCTGAEPKLAAPAA